MVRIFRRNTNKRMYLHRFVHCLRLILYLLAFILIIQTVNRLRFITSAAQEKNKPDAIDVAPIRLTASATISNLITTDSVNAYDVDLAADQYLRLVINRQGDAKLSIVIYKPDGAKFIERVSRSYGLLDLPLIAESSGRHRVEIRFLDVAAAGGHYELKVMELRDATARDSQSVAAASTFATAEQMRAEWREDSLRKAVEKYAEAGALWESASNTGEAVDALDSGGQIYFSLSEYEKALGLFKREFAKSLLMGDRRREIEALNNIGYVHVYRGQNRKALAYFTRALAYGAHSSSTAPGPLERRAEAQTLNNLGEVYYSLGDLKKALGLFNRALAVWMAVADRKGQALAHTNIGYTFYDMGDTQAASEHYQQSLSLWQAIGDDRGAALSRTAMGGVYSFTGERQLALEAHQQAAQTLRAIGDGQGEAAAHNGIGRVYEELNNPETALDNYSRALQLYQKIGNRDYEALTECYLGRVHRSMGNLPRALEYYRHGAALSHIVADGRIEAYALKDMATIYSALGHRERALNQYEEVLRLYRKFGDRRGQAHTLDDIGLIYQSANRQEKALSYYKQALSLYEAVGDRSNEAAAHFKIARVMRDLSQLDESLSQIKLSINIIEELRIRIASYELRSSYFALVREYYGFYIDLLMRLDKERPSQGFSGTALLASERARSRSLLEILMEAKAYIRQGVSSDLLEREHILQQQLSARARYQMRLLNNRRTSTEADTADLEGEIRQLTTEYQEVEARIREQSPRFATFTEPPLLSVEDIQTKLLDDETILLEYVLGDEKSFLWMVTRTSLESYQLPPRVQVEDQAREVYQLLAVRQTDNAESSAEYQKRAAEYDKQYWERAAPLSRLLLGPVAAQLAGKRLLIVADGALQYIPFESLPIPETDGPPETISRETAWRLPGEPIPVILRHEIVNLPSASTLISLREEKAQPEAALSIVAVLADPVFESDDPRVKVKASRASGFADKAAGTSESALLLRDVGEWSHVSGIPRLPSTLREAEAIMAVTPRNGGMLATGFEANRERAMSDELGHYQVVHFATHGVVNSEHPELSGLLLSMVNERGEAENGFLQLHDIYNLNLSARLVVLSACNTGLGKDVKGEGLIGLTRGFMYAGSKGVIASLWKVDDDATAELMSHFYEALLKEHRPPAAALKAAKEALWQQRRWHSPFYWAAFVLQGDYAGNIKADGEPLKIPWKIAAIVIICPLTAGSIFLIRKMRRMVSCLK